MGEQPVQIPGREGEWHIPSSLAQNWMHEKESTAPGGNRNEQGSLGTQALRICVVPTVAQVMWLFSLEILLHVLECWVPRWAPSHPRSPFILIPTLPDKNDYVHFADWESEAPAQSVWILPGSSVGYAMSPRLLHLGPGAQ